LIAITRAGYGESDDVDCESYSYEVLVGDIRAVVDSLGVDKFHVLGHSSGGPCALAVKYLISDRCRKCIVLAGDTEYATNEELDPMAF